MSFGYLGPKLDSFNTNNFLNDSNIGTHSSKPMTIDFTTIRVTTTNLFTVTVTTHTTIAVSYTFTDTNTLHIVMTRDDDSYTDVLMHDVVEMAPNDTVCKKCMYEWCSDVKKFVCRECQRYW